MKVAFELFRARLKSWEETCSEAAEFAATIPPERLITISHSEDQNASMIIVWYRTE